VCKFLSFAVHPFFFFFAAVRIIFHFASSAMSHQPPISFLQSVCIVSCPSVLCSRFLFMLPFCSCSQLSLFTSSTSHVMHPGPSSVFKSESTFAVRRSVRESKKKAALFARATIPVPIFMASYLTPSVQVGRWTLDPHVGNFLGPRPPPE
jgi:hypothetical protein